jgi:hypothetical protein
VPRGLTVLAAVRAGDEQCLRDVLLPIGDDIRGRTLTAAAPRPHIDFSSSRGIHFARFAILDDSDRGPDRKRLLYSSNYDGDLDAHLAELIAITSDMNAIWGCCEDYTGVDRFGAFVRAHTHEPEAFYIAFREETVAHIRQAIALRRQVEPLLDTPAAALLAKVLPGASSGASSEIGAVGRALATAGREIAAAIARFIRAAPIVIDMPRAVIRCGLKNVYIGTLRIIASLDRYAIFKFVNGLTGNRLPPMTSVYSSVELANPVAPAPIAPGKAMPPPADRLPPAYREDVVTQNQLTLVTDVQPGQADRVRAVMAAIDSYAKRLAPPGSLIGISTIHFVRWLLLDDGRRLMMVSDYDGSWESYIDEFAELILSGLDAIWETSLGYPPDGARDLPAFKRFLRSHQRASLVFYSAYPDETVLNIANDRALAEACADITDRTGGLLQRV